MKNIYLLLLIALSVLSACGEKETLGNNAGVSGEIKGLGNDTIYIYGVDKLYDRMDTLVVANDKFSATLPVDTLVAATMLFSNGAEYPLFLNKGNQIVIKGTLAELHLLQITGNKANEELSTFNQGLEGLGKASDKVLETKAETFIYEHPSSLASIYLLRKYFVQQPQPDFSRIKTMVERMTGELKDRPYIDELSKQIQEVEKVEAGKIAPYFRLKSAEGKEILRANFKDQYLLIQFWASWDSASREKNAMFRRIYKKEQKNKNFAILGISLDIDKEKWLKAIKTDTLKWEQACDFLGWNAEVVKQYAIRKLPSNILLSPVGRIDGKDLDEEAIEEKLKEIEKIEKDKQNTRNTIRR